MAVWIQLKRGGNDMRRQLCFNYSPEENKYIIQENGKCIFCIDRQTLEFVSSEFYNGVYSCNKSTAIDFKNNIVGENDDLTKIGNYIFKWVSQIFKAIEDELPEDDKSEMSK